MLKTLGDEDERPAIFRDQLVYRGGHCVAALDDRGDGVFIEPRPERTIQILARERLHALPQPGIDAFTLVLQLLAREGT